ncbi:MAG: carboxypeptidase-like regulatory domain-containing protein [Parachlamydia sp.]|nr:carboxypeptidase-like regulatory domain-containing protein [Parachlamydia sp.]
MPTLSVRVIDEDGNGISGTNVFVHYPHESTHDEGYTDSNGCIDFDAPDYTEAEVTACGETVNISIQSGPADCTISPY